MDNFDDIFAPKGRRDDFFDQPFNVDEWAEKKQAERQELYAVADSTAAVAVSNGEYFQQYLDTQARFGGYSPTNVLLIIAQRPDATQLKEFDDWKEAGFSIKKNEKGFCILKPGDEYTRDDGTIGTGFDVKRVFDISQTTARPRTQPTATVDDRTLLKALINRSPVQMQMVDSLDGNMGALYDHDQQVIFVRRGMDAHDLFRCVSKELAHAEIAGTRENYDRREASLAAYSASYILCRQNNVQPESRGFAAVPGELAGKDPQEIRAALTEIHDTAKTISNRMYRVLEQAKAPKHKDQER